MRPRPRARRESRSMSDTEAPGETPPKESETETNDDMAWRLRRAVTNAQSALDRARPLRDQAAVERLIADLNHAATLLEDACRYPGRPHIVEECAKQVERLLAEYRASL